MNRELDISYTQNRELSWLRFNERVLEEACDEETPLLERLKFAAIFTSNLDEFFMIRVGSLFELSLVKDDKFDNKSFLKPSEQLQQIFKAARTLYEKRDRVFEDLRERLALVGVEQVRKSKLTADDLAFLQEYFRDNVFPILSPQIIDLHHPFPHLVSKGLYIAVLLKYQKKLTLGIIQIPKALPQVIYLPSASSVRYILLEDLLLSRLGEIFSLYSLIDKAVISITRNADISIDDEAPELGDDYLQYMRQALKKRRLLAPVRLELKTQGDSLLTDYLRKRFNIKRTQVFSSRAPLDMSYVFELPSRLSSQAANRLLYKPFQPSLVSEASPKERLLDYVQRQDLLLQYPYQSFDLFLNLVREAVQDDSVVAIKITIYRVGRRKAKLINYLITAAESGKDVTVLMELKARFDEENNINWAESLQEAGCHIQYGFEGYKVHSKICLITRLQQGKISYVTQIGTGNYNAQTAGIYTDLSLITASEAIGREADSFFKNMGLGNLYGSYEQLLVAPVNLKPRLVELIRAEGAKARAGQPARIILKMNSLTDRTLIDELQRASQDGVKVRLIVRGICCLRPGISGKTDNIIVKSIVGRFLEHSRIFCFGVGEDCRLYISSADWMTRNTENRVEIACPILAQPLRHKLIKMLDILLADNVKGRLLQPDGSYAAYPPLDYQLSSQQYYIDMFENNSNLKL